jgi:catechol 2,3-dioxygenase-like lactoylglutathione lyase family enzyme
MGLRRPAPILPVRDLEAALAFYAGLGFSVRCYDEGYAFARRERLLLHLSVTPELDPFTNHSALYVDTAEVDALHAEWLALDLWAVPPITGPEILAEARRRWEAGAPIARITDVVEAKPWRVREFTLLDLDNNELRFGAAAN